VTAPALHPMFRVREVAARYAVDDKRVIAWIRSGELRAIDVSEGSGRKARWRIKPEWLAEFEAAREAKTSPSPRPSRRAAKSGWQFTYF
jgi:hypothetical protein